MQLSKHTLRTIVIAMLASGASHAIAASTMTREHIISEADKVAEAQLKALGEKANIDWTWGVMEAGYAEFSHVSPKGAEYSKALTALADKAKWTPLLHPKTPFHADDFCIGQTFEDLYVGNPEAAKLAPLKSRLDALAEELEIPPGSRSYLPPPTTKPAVPRLTFYWCDALFMAPPVLCRMSAITGDKKFIDAMDKEYWRTTALLYDSEEHLFFRDRNFLTKTDANGKKIFWSRGNGWVLAGLARVLEHMPKDYSSRPKYEAMFKEIAAKVITLQRPDGTWSPSLLDPALFDQPETSGTALFTYGLAWGINHNLLDAATYQPVVAKAWAALLSHRRDDGLPGYSQSADSQPNKVSADGTQVYTTGGYLLAASQLQKLAPLILTVDLPPVVKPAEAAVAAPPATQPAQPAPDAKCFARHVPERMDDIAWENDRIAHRIYGPALQHNPREHSGSGIDVWVKSVRYPVINDWYKRNNYHVNHGTGLDFYEVGLSRGDGGLGIWDGKKLFNSKDWVDEKILDLGPDQCGFTIRYDPWDANGRKVWEHRTMTLKAGSNLSRIESTIDSDKPGEIIVGIGLAKRDGKGGKLFDDKELGVMSYWQPPEKDGTIGVGVKVDPAMIAGFDEDKLNYLVLVKATAGKPLVYYAGACWDKGLDFHSAEKWEKYLKEFKRE
jgi:rhamnogalacturonyl hydrolase YesR